VDSSPPGLVAQFNAALEAARQNKVQAQQPAQLAQVAVKGEPGMRGIAPAAIAGEKQAMALEQQPIQWAPEPPPVRWAEVAQPEQVALQPPPEQPEQRQKPVQLAQIALPVPIGPPVPIPSGAIPGTPENKKAAEPLAKAIQNLFTGEKKDAVTEVPLDAPQMTKPEEIGKDGKPVTDPNERKPITIQPQPLPPPLEKGPDVGVFCATLYARCIAKCENIPSLGGLGRAARGVCYGACLAAAVSCFVIGNVMRGEH
jgi:hypothetical protein